MSWRRGGGRGGWGRSALAVLVAVTLGACSSLDVTVSRTEPEVIEEVVFDESLQIDLELMTRLESGVYIQDIEEGAGAELGEDDAADIFFTGWLRTGIIFDQGEISFQMGNSEVIPGLELGILGMKAGGTRLIIVPPELGYGAAILGSIPPGSILVLQVELQRVIPAP